MAFALTLTRNRTSYDTITLYESDGETGVALAATDVVRFKMYRRNNDAPDLDLDSAADTANGSGITITQTASAATATLKIAQSDTSSLIPGPYRAEIAVVDDSDSDRIKSAEHGVVYLLGAPGGDIALS